MWFRAVLVAAAMATAAICSAAPSHADQDGYGNMLAAAGARDGAMSVIVAVVGGLALVVIIALLVDEIRSRSSR